jgi:predicted enzyme related to lactoylglutathione lyase
MTETTQAPPTPGTFCWNELMTSDAEASKKFLTTLFGWTTETMELGPDTTYTMFKKGEQYVAGMMPMVGEQWKGVPPHWMGYVAVEDVDAMAKRVTDLGGTVCVPPTDVPNVGRFAVINDPSGATFSLWKAMPCEGGGGG